MMLLTLQTTFTVYLLEDHYKVTDDRAAKVLGNLGFMGDIASISSEFLVGYAMDLFGRKGPTVAGLVMAGLSTFAMPIPKKLGGLYCLRALTNIGSLPINGSPYMVDYVQKESLGRMSGILALVSQASSIIATAGAIQV